MGHWEWSSHRCACRLHQNDFKESGRSVLEPYARSREHIFCRSPSARTRLAGSGLRRWSTQGALAYGTVFRECTVVESADVPNAFWRGEELSRDLWVVPPGVFSLKFRNFARVSKNSRNKNRNGPTAGFGGGDWLNSAAVGLARFEYGLRQQSRAKRAGRDRLAAGNLFVNGVP